MAPDRVRIPRFWSSPLNRFSRVVERHPAVFAGFVIFAIVVASIALTMQGWRSRIPAFDDLTYFYDARRFLLTGMMSRFGDVDSYGSYSAPGTTWLMLPGLLLFRDPRLVEYAGAALLHIATLTGLFLLARRFFGLWCAALAVLLYGLSATALFFAGSLWPIARPDFYVLTAWLACYWVLKRDARYVAASLTVWAFGLYVDMALLPVGFIYPVLWFCYRPPLRIRPLMVSAVLIVAIWSPYLRFEASRKFLDIRSQLLQQHVPAGDFRKAWCDPSLVLQQWQDASASSGDLAYAQPIAAPASLPSRLILRIGSLWQNLLSNFDAVAPIRGASLGLLLAMAFSMLYLTATVASPIRPASRALASHGRARSVAIALLVAGVSLGAAAYLWTWQRAPGSTMFSLAAKVAKLMLASGLAWLLLPLLQRATHFFLGHLKCEFPAREEADQNQLLALSLIVPWIVLLLFAEPGKPERFIWLWPLQVLFLAALPANILPRLHLPRLLNGIVVALLLTLLVGNSFLLDRLSSWRRNGWAGTDAGEVQAVNTVAGALEAEGRSQASIGYQLYIYSFMADDHVINPRYKVGAELDLLFDLAHGISNLDQCAEGFSPADEYRIVEIVPKPVEGAPSEYFLVDMGSEFSLLGRFGSYQVYKRTWPPASG